MTIPVSRLTRTPDQLHEVRSWLWTVHLADSPRALISAGRWHDALAHLETHNGIGQRLLDGRQIAVITRYLAGDTSGALALLRDSSATKPWEDLIRYCLTMLCTPEQPAPRPQRRTMLRIYRRLLGTPQLTVFLTRLGLTIIDTAGEGASCNVNLVAHDLAAHAITWQDGYASRDILTHPGCLAVLTKEESRSLAHIADLCALARGEVPAETADQLTNALSAAERTILQHQHWPAGTHIEQMRASP